MKLPKHKSIFHTFTQDKYGDVNIYGDVRGVIITKYIHPIYGYEVVLDNSNNIVNIFLNAGTYNYSNPCIQNINAF